MQFIDIHTHSNKETESLNIINIFPENIDTIEENKFYSLGLHPWQVLNVNIEEQLTIIEDYAEKPNIIAIGEAGLDKYKAAFDLQLKVFLKQIKIAGDHNKPIIIHCVKAYSELLEIFKKEKFKIPVIIHRYSGNKTIADQLLKYNCYLSFGHELFNSKSKVQRVFKSIPAEQIFLETDDSGMDIEQVYQKASELKCLEIKELSKAINSNFENCFYC